MMHVRFTAQTAVLYQSVPTDLKIEKSSGDIELDVSISLIHMQNKMIYTKRLLAEEEIGV